MKHTVESLFNSQGNSLQEFYQHFNVSGRVLLSGHSHQAWPDAAKQGQVKAFDDAALHVDDKWGAAFSQAEKVRSFYRDRLGDDQGEIVLGASTHDLLLRYFSDLPWFQQPGKRKVVTTDGEFHSLRRQLDRLVDAGVIDLVRVPVNPQESLAERLAAELDQHTLTLMMSAVFFNSGRIFSQVGEVAAHARQKDIPVLVDAYHAINVVPFNLAQWGLADCFVVGGGYKYCQAGEGNCFMRLPKGYQGQPIVTGWYAEFAQLDQSAGQKQRVAYGRGQDAFAGSTYDPTSHYRGAAVFDFFHQQALSVDLLRATSQRQIGHLWQGIAGMNLPADQLALPEHELIENAGFLTLHCANASQWVDALKAKGVQCDSRGQNLRLGPAPYVSQKQLDLALNALEDIGRQGNSTA